MPQIYEFLQMKWTGTYGDTTFTFRQKLMEVDFYSIDYIIAKMSEEGRFIPKFTLNLKVLKTDNNLPSSDSVPISKTFFCRLIEFGEEEVQFLFGDKVLYVKELSIYFGNQEFVQSEREDGNHVVKLCMDDLPFRQISSGYGETRFTFEFVTRLLTIVVLPVLKRLF
ncbi:hypothetical protein DPMN_188027 [Dreissena polymorpha]|uniref:Uncharacterized protein n=1 Tax=Dreissena polymorpha TaxID=45954 RepID=A0A9D4DRB3_DREPO|nr:hypothetical protein DPMN_188027 [Dreissena polymorpha]